MAGMEDEENPTPANEVKLPQSEAIMEAIIRSSKPLPIDKEDDVCNWKRVDRFLLQFSDPLVPWIRLRWIFCFVEIIAFGLWIYTLDRHYFAAYVLAIYILNQVLLFVSPATEDDRLLLGKGSSEYRPFIRALSEFRLWGRSFASTAAAFAATFFDDLDLEVDPSVLLLYFLLLFIYTMKQQIVHMIQYSYVPWNRSKKKASKEESLDV
mmetsp:Transcript_53605/g.100482  ORF Transcript_53605/g.100482 Transcript_53605/m.100482 type:complete len:209 (+) Transcript_53605:39-665(+)